MNLSKALTAAITKGALSATRKPIAALRSDVALLKREAKAALGNASQQ